MDIFEACRWNIKRRLQELLSSGIDVNAADEDGFTLLEMACYYDLYDIASLLISAGADVNLKGRYHETPIYLASYRCHPRIVFLLLCAGADINILSNNETPIESIRKGLDGNMVLRFPYRLNKYKNILELLEAHQHNLDKKSSTLFSLLLPIIYSRKRNREK